MAVTNAPIFPQTPNPGALGSVLSTAMTATKGFDGTETVGTSMALGFTAGANGARVDSVVFNYSSTAGATPSGTTNASVVRVWGNNGSANTTATNNYYLGSLTVPAQSYANVNTSAIPSLTLPVGFSLPAGHRLYFGLATALGGTNTALSFVVNGGDY